jgi:iron-sulfur cluster assembly accessory protein
MELIEITDEAIKILMDKKANDQFDYIRLGIKGGGCAGFGYDWTFEDTPNDTDLVVDDTLLVDKIYEMYILGMQLDYKNDIFGANFIFNNPKAKSSCGCGTSFSI